MMSIFTGGMSRYVTEAYARGDLAGVTKVVSSQFPILFVAGLAVMLLGGMTAWNIQHILTVPPDYVGKLSAWRYSSFFDWLLRCQ